jgi:hypothetical protein
MIKEWLLAWLEMLMQWVLSLRGSSQLRPLCERNTLRSCGQGCEQAGETTGRHHLLSSDHMKVSIKLVFSHASYIYKTENCYQIMLRFQFSVGCGWPYHQTGPWRGPPLSHTWRGFHGSASHLWAVRLSHSCTWQCRCHLLAEGKVDEDYPSPETQFQSITWLQI